LQAAIPVSEYGYYTKKEFPCSCSEFWRPLDFLIDLYAIYAVNAVWFVRQSGKL
jgi:hypothetical protein